MISAYYDNIVVFIESACKGGECRQCTLKIVIAAGLVGDLMNVERMERGTRLFYAAAT